ncbi:10790_t:CDS:2, partial [Funneliformis geosporum]
MGRKPHVYTKYFKILPKLANVSNKVCICLVCYNTNPDRPHKELTNTPKLCKNHLKKCPYFLSQYSKEELTVIFSDANDDNDDHSEIEISEPTTKRARIEKKSQIKVTQFQNINIIVSTQSDSKEEIDNDNISNSETDPIELVNHWNIIVGDWLNLLDNKEFKSEEEIGIINHPATNQE